MPGDHLGAQDDWALERVARGDEAVAGLRARALAAAGVDAGAPESPAAPESQQLQRVPAPASSVEGTWPVASRRRCTHLVGSTNSTRVSLTDVVAMTAGRSAPSGTFSYGV